MDIEKSEKRVELSVELITEPVINLVSQLTAKQAPHQTTGQTAGQIERNISQKIQALYKRILGHQTGRVTCQLFDAKVAVVLENSITQPVQLLIEAGYSDLAQQVRSDISSTMQPLIKTLLFDVLGVEVLDVMSDASLATGRTGIVCILANSPAVRSPDVALKASKKSS